jgi:hypothetical protein
MTSLPVAQTLKWGCRALLWVLISRRVTLTEARKVRMKVCPGARVLWEKFGNNVDEGFGVVILSDGADHIEDVVCDKGGRLLNREYETRARVDPGGGG